MAKKEKKQKPEKKTYLWKDRKHTLFGLPWSFTKYALDEERLYITTGFFTSVEDEVRLYRITDVTLRRSFGQKLVGVGTIHCDSSDATQQNFDIKHIRHPAEVKEMLSRLVDESRQKHRVFTSESVTGHPHAFEGQNPPPPPPVDRTDANRNGVPDSLER